MKRMNVKMLGEIFVEDRVLSQKTVDRVLGQSQKMGRRFGDVLENLGLITGAELSHALAVQYGCKTVSRIDDIPVDAKLLKLISVEQAMTHMVFPLKKDSNRLALAMTDPTDSKFKQGIEDEHKLQVIPYIASKDDVRNKISRHYLKRDHHRSSKRTVLVVDDDKLIRTMLKDFLEKKEYHVLLAADGLEAFKLVVSDSPHVVICDMIMPKFDGFNFFNSMKAIPEFKHVPVIMITGKEQAEQDEYTAFEKGFFDVIMKPISEQAIQARVKRAFHFYDNQYRLY